MRIKKIRALGLGRGRLYLLLSDYVCADAELTASHPSSILLHTGKGRGGEVVLFLRWSKSKKTFLLFWSYSTLVGQCVIGWSDICIVRHR